MTALYRHNKDSRRYDYRIIWSRDSSSSLARARTVDILSIKAVRSRIYPASLPLGDKPERRIQSASIRGDGIVELTSAIHDGMQRNWGRKSRARCFTDRNRLLFRGASRLVHSSRQRMLLRRCSLRERCNLLHWRLQQTPGWSMGSNAGIAARRYCSHKLWRGRRIMPQDVHRGFFFFFFFLIIPRRKEWCLFFRQPLNFIIEMKPVLIYFSMSIARLFIWLLR